MNGVLVLVLGVSALQLALGADPKLDPHWAQFKTKHGKEYSNEAEEAQRREIFESNVKHVAEHNALHDAGLVSYAKSAHHPHGDKTFEELQSTILATKTKFQVIPPSDTSQNFSSVISNRGHWWVDWRPTRVTSVKDQGGCGSCWTYSVTGAVEGHLPRINKQLKDLSNQQLVDCASDRRGETGGDGCNGGWPQSAFQYVEKYGLQSQSSYPYKAKQENCKYNSGSVVDGTRIKGYVDIAPSGDEMALENFVGPYGPASVAIHVNSNFMNYKSGIFDDPNCSKDVNHGVLIVGYGRENDMDYWIVKNSWGPNWGDKGYIRMRRKSNNMCAIASYASYPKME